MSVPIGLNFQKFDSLEIAILKDSFYYPLWKSYLDGESLKEISLLLQCTQPTVARRFREMISRCREDAMMVRKYKKIV